ncbi:MAG TPA: CHASE3 domain-containing protein [Burkholderiales bacterium]|nr:CHASE3 domain-containing protein [Burkholderiales bacterium]
MWTFGRRIAVGFTVSTALLLLIGVVAHRSIGVLVDTGQWVAHTHSVLEALGSVSGSMSEIESSQRGFVIAGSEPFLVPYQQALDSVPLEMKRLRELTSDNPAHQRSLDQAQSLIAEKLAVLAKGIEIRREKGAQAAMNFIAAGEGRELMARLQETFAQMERAERDLLKTRTENAQATVAATRQTIVFGTLICVIFAIGAGTILTRSLSARIGGAVANMRSSSTELQAAATQQATGTKEQASAMTEISTTISELLLTSRQIAESAQRVAQIAAQTAGAAQSGDSTVASAQESIAAIRRQVDLIVSHMLELGKKSQQIGAVLDIVSELSEQTNILAINATIEAAGAGEGGRRFAVVADEIRKLADRVGGSTKQIRALIDDVRSAVNTTVMTTESGSKTVDAGSRRFAEVTLALEQIASLVSTTTEAAREIELSTKQQSTAVEQVNFAIRNVAQATKETEVSSGQTLLTASQLSTLSGELLRLIRPQQMAA